MISNITEMISSNPAFQGEYLIRVTIPVTVASFFLIMSFVVGFYSKRMVDAASIVLSTFIWCVFLSSPIMILFGLPNSYYFFKGLYEGNRDFPGVSVPDYHVPSPPGHPNHGGILDTLGIESILFIVLSTFIMLGAAFLFIFFLVLVFGTERMRRDNRREAIENEKKWEYQINRFNEIMSDYFERDRDPNTMLTIPMIRYVKAKMVQDFHARKEEVKEIISQGEKDNAEELTTAVNKLDSSWTQLLDKAKEVGTPGLSSVDMDNARKALSMMMDESLSLRERRKYQDQLNEIMIKSVNKDDDASGNRILSSMRNVLGKIRI